ncbi:hypothetical protein J3R82DRAFT_2742 [Butyriboletus roseoflavus]|nr:hypothetical protein J3R82DRAFT_2742 [Butyriboletus roseoflavus]
MFRENVGIASIEPLFIAANIPQASNTRLDTTSYVLGVSIGTTMAPTLTVRLHLTSSQFGNIHSYEPHLRAEGTQEARCGWSHPTTQKRKFSLHCNPTNTKLTPSSASVSGPESPTTAATPQKIPPEMDSSDDESGKEEITLRTTVDQFLTDHVPASHNIITPASSSSMPTTLNHAVSDSESRSPTFQLASSDSMSESAQHVFR